ncbi:unnamed protein product [Schistosoma turkestanicum]|nr:unnamed protein product [Schistosoma turkestanicum]
MTMNSPCISSVSPLQSTSHSVGLHNDEKYPNRRRHSLSIHRMIKRKQRQHQSSFNRHQHKHQVSKSPKVVTQFHSRKRSLHHHQHNTDKDDHHVVPNAPRPSLKYNKENVLFVKPNHHLSKFQLDDQTNHSNNNNDQCSIEQHERILPREINITTSTPFMKSFTNCSTLLNSALVGAPRLALNVSFRNNPHEPDNITNVGHVDNMRYSPNVTPIMNVISTSLSYDQENSIYDHNVDDQNEIELSDIHNTSNNHNNELLKPIKIYPTYQTLPTCTNDVSLLGGFRCRICLEEGDETEALLSPCRCKGTVGLVHRKCLEKWLLTSGKPNCELCGYAYIMTPSKRRHSSQLSTAPIRRLSNELRSIRDWLSWPRTRRHLIADIICMILLTPATYIGVYFCALGAFGYAEYNPFAWQVFGLWGLAVLLILLLTTWMILAIRHHVGNFRSYQHYQQQVALAEAARLSALPRYRFSVQPRPRGSSVVLYTIHKEQDSSPLSIHETQLAMSSSSTENVDLSTSINREESTGNSSKYTNGNQKIVVSVELTTVPEVTEEMSVSNSNTNNSNNVTYTNIV